jgi:hypothetical protein
MIAFGVASTLWGLVLFAQTIHTLHVGGHAISLALCVLTLPVQALGTLVPYVRSRRGKTVLPSGALALLGGGGLLTIAAIAAILVLPAQGFGW